MEKEWHMDMSVRTMEVGAEYELSLHDPAQGKIRPYRFTVLEIGRFATPELPIGSVHAPRIRWAENGIETILNPFLCYHVVKVADSPQGDGAQPTAQVPAGDAPAQVDKSAKPSGSAVFY